MRPHFRCQLSAIAPGSADGKALPSHAGTSAFLGEGATKRYKARMPQPLGRHRGTLTHRSHDCVPTWGGCGHVGPLRLPVQVSRLVA
jgi:hypothetical protein